MRIKKRSVIEICFLFVLGGILISFEAFSGGTVLCILASLIVIGMMYATEGLAKKIFFALGLVACIQWPALLSFLPAGASVFFAESLSQTERTVFTLGIAFVFLLQDLSVLSLVLLVVLTGFGIYLSQSRSVQEKLHKDYLALKDDSWEQQKQLEDKNSQLMISQESSIDLEVTKERNRIARDIHDNVGHLLSSALIQLEAVRTINQQENLSRPLAQLHATIDQGMNNIRNSVHNTFQESLDFQQGLEVLLKDFTFCPVKVTGDTGIIPREIAQPLTMVVKEALSNVMKHSNAAEVQLTISELPAFYKCIIRDNGTNAKTAETKGIGLIGMEQRLKKIGGQLHVIPKDKSFTLNIILPKAGDGI